jgi:hypothetical protein
VEFIIFPLVGPPLALKKKKKKKKKTGCRTIDEVHRIPWAVIELHLRSTTRKQKVSCLCRSLGFDTPG